MDSSHPPDSDRSLIDVLNALSRGPTRYDEEQEVARGGMGTIHRVWDRDLRRHLAMKVFRGKTEVPDDASRDSAVDPVLARFVEEAQITGQLDHPGIVPVHEMGLDAEGRLFFTMRLVQGHTLGEVFERMRSGDAQWTEMRVLRALVRVCEAVAYAHSRGVVHRDLKPANIMVGPFGEVYVMDWGLAKVLGSEPKSSAGVAQRVQSDRVQQASAEPESYLLTMDGNVLGTPAYMPPEQARGELQDVGPHSDVYAIGALLYEFLTGRAPYSSKQGPPSALEVLEALLAGPPPPVTRLEPDAPAELVAICEKAMARDISQRFADPMEVAEELSHFFERPVTRARGVLRQSKLVVALQWVFGFLFWSFSIGLVAVVGVLVLAPFFSETTSVGVNLPVRFQITDPGFTLTSRQDWLSEVSVGELEGALNVKSTHGLFVLATTLVGFGALVFLLYIIQQTRHILRTLRRGEPFAASNMQRMRRIGVAMFLLGVVKTLQDPAAMAFVADFVSAQGLEWSRRVEIAYTEILVGILIFILAEVFKVGAELEKRTAATSPRARPVDHESGP